MTGGGIVVVLVVALLLEALALVYLYWRLLCLSEAVESLEVSHVRLMVLIDKWWAQDMADDEARRKAFRRGAMMKAEEATL